MVTPESATGEEVAKKKAATHGVFSGPRLASLRAKREMTQFQLGVAIETDPNIISRWERGVQIPDANETAKLSGALGVGIDELFD